MNCWNHSLSLPKQLTYFDISGSDSKGTGAVLEEESEKSEVGGKNCGNSTVFSSLPLAIKWLRDSVLQQNRSVRLQVMPFEENEFFFFPFSVFENDPIVFLVTIVIWDKSKYLSWFLYHMFIYYRSLPPKIF